jgi:hypothetical protein
MRHLKKRLRNLLVGFLLLVERPGHEILLKPRALLTGRELIHLVVLLGVIDGHGVLQALYHMWCLDLKQGRHAQFLVG